MKWWQVLLFNTNYSIQHNSFIYTKSNGFKNCYVIPIIQFRNIIKEFCVLLCITNNSSKHKDRSFVYTQSNSQTTLFQTFRFNVSQLSVQVKQFHLIHKENPIYCRHSWSNWTWKQCQWTGTPYSSELYWLEPHHHYRPIGALALLKKFWEISQTTIFDLPRNIWRVDFSYIFVIFFLIDY